MTRPRILESRARRIAREKHGNEDLWTVCISEASQQLTLVAMRARNGKE